MLKFLLAVAVAAAVATGTITAASADTSTPACATYAGIGYTALGPLTLSSDSVIYWHTNGTTFRMVNLDPSDANANVDTTGAGTGSTIVPAGTYSLQIITDGVWSLTIPGANCSLTSTSTTPTTTSTSSATAPTSTGSASTSGALNYSGSSNRQVGPFTLTGTATLYWRTDGNSFQMQNDDNSNANGIVGTTTAGFGSTILPAGTYTLDITTDGNWSLLIVQ